MTEAWKQWEGQVVNGEFRLRQYLGGSDHSAVFLTEYGERGLQRAAIKLIPADPANADLQLSRWNLAAKLSHPHLIRLLQMGRCQLGNTKQLFVVMEYADENLSQILPQRPLTPAEARELLAPTLDALAYLHGQGLVHGHLKPTNIMAVNDQLKLSSDGLYRRGESAANPGKLGIYDPPEKVNGTILAAGDVWSLGVTLAQGLTRHLPVWSENELGEPTLSAAMPAPFFDIARNCLRRNPQRRWTVADITGRLHQTPPPQKQTTVRSQAASTKRRLIVPAIAVGLALFAILVGPRLIHRAPEAEQNVPVALEQQKPPEPAPAPQPEPAAAAPAPVPPKATTSHRRQVSQIISPLPTTSRSQTEDETTTGSLDQGDVVHQVLPNVPQSARDTIQGTVRVKVRVHIDPSGNVTGAELDSPGPSKYFARLAMQAAQGWKFAPADGQDASREWILRFEFARTATRAFATKVAP